MINDPQMQRCPICHRGWLEHAKDCKYYSRPQPAVTETRKPKSTQKSKRRA